MNNKNEVLEYIKENSKTWWTIELSNCENLIRVYKENGLNYNRDCIDPKDLDEDNLYFEIDEEELINLINSPKLDSWLMNL